MKLLQALIGKDYTAVEALKLSGWMPTMSRAFNTHDGLTTADNAQEDMIGVSRASLHPYFIDAVYAQL